jgi:hypothetical protein
MAMARFIPEVVDLCEMDGGVKLAFNLMLYLGKHFPWRSLHVCVKMCGYGGIEKLYKALEDVMLALIERR